MTNNQWFQTAPLVIWETKRQQQCISLGAILSEMNGFTIDTIHPGRPPSDMQEWLATSWGIRNAADAENQVRWLLQSGHSATFDAVSRLCFDRSPEQIRTHLQNLSPSDPLAAFPAHEIHEFCTNYLECLLPLRELGYVAPSSNEAPSPRAWDIGRSVTVTRVAFGAKLLKRGAAKKLILQAGALASQEFSSWQPFAASYMFGRAVWGGVREESFVGQHQVTQELLRQPHSPWNLFGWPS